MSSEDLIPSDLAYIMGPGDFVSIAVQDLFTPGLWERVTRRVDAGGFIRAPALGDVQAAGFTPQELENALWELYNAHVITNPQVEVVVEEGSAFQYTVYGAVPAPGLYTLRDPDLRLLDALAAAGGASPSIIKSIYVIRSVGLSDDVQPFSDIQAPNVSSGQPQPSTPETVDIDDLINELDNDAVSPARCRTIRRSTSTPLIRTGDRHSPRRVRSVHGCSSVASGSALPPVLVVLAQPVKLSTLCTRSASSRSRSKHFQTATAATTSSSVPTTGST